MLESASGSCLCKAVQFTIRFPSNWVAHCHCTMCRRAHGAAFVTWVSVGADQFSLADEDAVRWHVSSPGAERGFCTRCGSSLFFRSSRWPGEMHVALANVYGEVDRAPQVHAFYDAHVPWLEVGDALPKKP